MPKKICPLWRDAIFTGVFNNPNNLDLATHLLALLFKLDVEKLKGKVKLVNRDDGNANVLNKAKKPRQRDLVLDYKGEKYNIEVDCRYGNYVMKKNALYAGGLYSSQVLKKVKPVNQMCVMMDNLYQNKLICRYPNKNEFGKETYKDTMRIYLLDVDFGLKNWYNGCTDRIMQFCQVLVADTEEKLRKYVKGVFNDMKMEKKLVKEILKLNSDPNYIEENVPRETMVVNGLVCEAHEDGMNEGLRKGESIGLRKGETIGFRKGSLTKQEEIAKAMVRDQVDKNIIAKYTGIPISKIASWY